MKLDQFKLTDPELYEIHTRFTQEEVSASPEVSLDEQTKYLSVLSALVGCQGVDAFEVVLKEVIDSAILSPVEVKEIVYQAIDYLGIGRVYSFLEVTNRVFESHNISLPLESQSTTTVETRLEKGIEAQVEIFGDAMKDFWKASHINRWLAGNCFGDYYTRKGLSLKQRELITFCFLFAQGGCEPQLISHIFGNLKLGNDFEYLLKVVSQCLPYVGYPRSLNAIAAINKAKEPKGV